MYHEKQDYSHAVYKTSHFCWFIKRFWIIKWLRDSANTFDPWIRGTQDDLIMLHVAFLTNRLELLTHKEVINDFNGCPAESQWALPSTHHLPSHTFRYSRCFPGLSFPTCFFPLHHSTSAMFTPLCISFIQIRCHKNSLYLISNMFQISNVW